MSTDSSEPEAPEACFIPIADPAHSYLHRPFAWSSDGARLAVAEGPQLRIYGLGGAQLREFEALGGEPIGELAWSPCDDRIAVATDGDMIYRHRAAIIDGETGERLDFDAEHDARIDDLRWSPTGETIASVGDDLMLWAAGQGTLLRRCLGDEPVRFSKDGLRVARVHDDFFEILDRVDSGADRRFERRSSWKHASCWWDVSEAPSTSAVDLHSDGPRTLMLWGLGELPPFGRTLTWAPDRPLAIAEGDRHGMLFFQPGEPAPRVLDPLHERTVGAIAWSADGARIASGGRGRRVLLWSRRGAATGERPPGMVADPARPTLRGQITELAWAADGSRLAIRAHGGIQLWTPSRG